MNAPRPWWASAGPVDGGVDPTEDPLVAHRTARRGGEPDPRVDRDAAGPDAAEGEAAGPTQAGSASGPTQAGSASGPTQAGSASGPTQAGSASGPTQPGSEICGVCPVCIAARMLGETRPELLAHLTEAGRHLGAALTTLLESRSGREQDAGPDTRRVRRIDLD